MLQYLTLDRAQQEWAQGSPTIVDGDTMTVSVHDDEDDVSMGYPIITLPI